MKKETKAVLWGLVAGGAAVFVLYQIRANQKNAQNQIVPAGPVDVIKAVNLVPAVLERGNPTANLDPRNINWSPIWGGRH